MKTILFAQGILLCRKPNHPQCIICTSSQRKRYQVSAKRSSVVRRLTVGPTGQDDRAMKPARDSNPESPDVEAFAERNGEIIYNKKRFLECYSPLYRLCWLYQVPVLQVPGTVPAISHPHHKKNGER